MVTDKKPFNTSYWVELNRLMAGPHPLGMYEPAPPDIIERFLACNVRHFVDLTERGECGPYIDTWEPLNGTPAPDLFTYQHFPIRDFTAPPKNVAVKILDYIDARIAEIQGAVYLHCLAGLGRTGTIAGLYLARHGVAHGKEVLQKIRMLRSSLPYPHCNADSPQSIDQLLMVSRWLEGE